MIRIAFCQTNRLFILLERTEKEIRFSMANGTFKMKMDIDHHCPSLMPNNCINLNPSYFSLPSTFKNATKISDSHLILFPPILQPNVIFVFSVESADDFNKHSLEFLLILPWVTEDTVIKYKNRSL